MQRDSLMFYCQHLLGMGHKRLTYKHNGRQFRLTDVAGEVVRKVLA